MTPNHENLLAFCLFADDARTEESGKDLLVGLYYNQLIIPRVPSKIDRLKIVVEIRMKKAVSFSRLKIHCHAGDYKAQLADEEFKRDDDDDTQGDGFIAYRRVFDLEGIEITSEEPLVVNASFDDHDVELGRLSIYQEEQEKSEGNVFAPLLFYSIIASDFSEQDKSEAARIALKQVLEALPPTPQKEKGRNLIIKLKHNLRRVYFENPCSDLNYNVKITNVKPRDCAYTVVHRNRFYCEIQFDEQAEEVEKFVIRVA